MPPSSPARKLPSTQPPRLDWDCDLGPSLTWRALQHFLLGTEQRQRKTHREDQGHAGKCDGSEEAQGQSSLEADPQTNLRLPLSLSLARSTSCAFCVEGDEPKLVFYSASHFSHSQTLLTSSQLSVPQS